MQILDALLFSETGQAKLTKTSTNLPDGFQAKLVPYEEDGETLFRAEIMIPSAGDTGEWEVFEDLPILLRAELVEAEWEPIDPKHPLQWLAEQAE